jgi:hypothetical protein
MRLPLKEVHSRRRAPSGSKRFEVAARLLLKVLPLIPDESMDPLDRGRVLPFAERHQLLAGRRQGHGTDRRERPLQAMRLPRDLAPSPARMA